MNKVILMGRLVKDPEVKYTQNNIIYTSFRLAVNRRFAGNSEQKADFINIITWNKTAEFCSLYFKKGQQVGVIGRIHTRNYEDQNGKKVFVTEVIGEEAYFAGGNAEGTNTSNTKVEAQTVDFSNFEDDFEIQIENLEF